MSLSITKRTSRSIENCVIMTTFLLALQLLMMNSSLQAQTPPADFKKKNFIVVIDPGHGGKDPGAVGKISKEKDIALSIAKQTGEYISSLMSDVDVIYTRTTDVYIDLSLRADIAVKKQADLFISIHANANNNSSIYGAETYVMGQSKSDKNFEIAKLENSVIAFEEDKTTWEGFDFNDPGSYIMFSVQQNTFLEFSLSMASKVQDQMRIRGKRKDGGVRQGPFLVLWRTARPSVLIETGYISNTEEEKFLNTENGQDVIASAIYSAFRKYKEEIDLKTANLIVDKESAITEPAVKEKTTATTIKEEVEEKVSEKDKIEAVKDESPKPDTIVKVKESKELPAEVKKGALTFRVQVMASREKILPGSKHLKGEKELEEFYLDGYYKYMTAPVSTYSQSQEIRKRLTANFPGAFIIAFLDGKKIPVEEGIRIDKENK